MKIRVHAGFTLVELLVVITIITILVSIGVFQFNKYMQNTNLKNAARSLEGNIQRVKQMASADSANYTISFSVNQNNYTLNTTNSEIINFSSFGNVALTDTGNINNNMITLLSRGTTDTAANQDTVTLKNGVLSTANIQTTSMGKVNVSYVIK